MASDMQKSAKRDHIRYKNRNEFGRWSRPRSRLRLDSQGSNREFPGRRREPRRQIFNGRNSTPRSNGIGVRDLYARNDPRIRTMDTGPPPASMQPFRLPPPMNNSCHFTPNSSDSLSFNSSRIRNRNNQSHNRYSNSNQAFHPVHYQQHPHVYSESVPANHVQMPHMRCNYPCAAPSYFRPPRRYNGGFAYHHHPRRLNQHAPNWELSQSRVGVDQSAPESSHSNDRHQFSSFSRASDGRRPRFVSRRPFSRGRRGGRGCRGERGGRGGGRDHLRSTLSRPTKQTKRHLRWKNNYRDLQREIRCYFRITSRDPLGLDDICRENRRRDNLGLTPLRGDSAMNTPAYSLNTPIPHREIEAPSQPNCVTGPNMTPQSNASAGLPTPETNVLEVELELALETPSPQLSENNLDAPKLERLMNGKDEPVDSSREENEALSREITPQSRTSDSEAAERLVPVPRVADDPFHERHRNVVTMNARGGSRFAERTITGNYHNYYTRRPVGVSETLLRPYVESRRCLDVGCNNGTVTFKLAEMQPISIMGIDSDGRLIQEARRTHEIMRRQRERLQRVEGANEGDQDCYLDTISFQTADYVPPFDSFYLPQYDTIFALSVTKWVHLVHGDTGLVRFLRRCHGELHEGGHLVIEPQLLRSYRSSYVAGRHTDPDSLTLIPPFEAEIQNIGFTRVTTSTNARSGPSDFLQRNIYIYLKSSPACMSTQTYVDTYPQPPSCHYYPSPLYRRVTSTQPSSSLNLPMTPVLASPTGSYLNETPGPSHALMHRYDSYPAAPLDSPHYRLASPQGRLPSPQYSPADSYRDPSPNSAHSPSPPPRQPSPADPFPLADEQPTSTSASSAGESALLAPDEGSAEEEDRSGEEYRERLPLNFVIPRGAYVHEETTSGGASEASTSAANNDCIPKRDRLTMKLRRLDPTRWAIDGSDMVYEENEEEFDGHMIENGQGEDEEEEREEEGEEEEAEEEEPEEEEEEVEQDEDEEEEEDEDMDEFAEDEEIFDYEEEEEEDEEEDQFGDEGVKEENQESSNSSSSSRSSDDWVAGYLPYNEFH